MKITSILKNKYTSIVGKAVLALGFFILFINTYIKISTKNDIYTNTNSLPKYYTAIVLGARVYKSGQPSIYLKDRLNKALELYNNGIVKRILLSGDHGTKNYDEVNNMKAYLLKKGIPTEDIFLDHAGFDTFSSMQRAKKVFLINDAIIVSQKFHLARAVYLAQKSDISACGIIADSTAYDNLLYLEFREYFARIKAFFNIIFKRIPKYLGEPIPITGNSSLSYD